MSTMLLACGGEAPRKTLPLVREHEPNDASAQANGPFGANGARVTVADGADEDWLFFKVKPGMRGTVTARRVDAWSCHDSYFELVGPGDQGDSAHFGDADTAALAWDTTADKGPHLYGILFWPNPDEDYAEPHCTFHVSVLPTDALVEQPATPEDRVMLRSSAFADQGALP